MKQDMPLLAKISQPQPLEAYARHRLFEILDKNRRNCGTWVGGPAGCGKTTLVSSYVAQRDLSCIWFKIDRGDSDAASFFYYLRQAAMASSTKTGPNIPLLTPKSSQEILIFTKRFFERMFDRLCNPFVIVFDNYQEIGSNTVLDKILCQALSVVPRKSHIYILSRKSPPPPLTRSVANNRLSVMRAQTLRLTREETEAIVHLKGASSWPKASIDQLHVKTDGWAAGITLILKQAENEAIDPLHLSRLPNRELFDYFAEEIFKGLDANIQFFLIKSAVSPHITSDMAQCLCDAPDAEIILSKLHRDHFFTLRHLGSPTYYQFHPLFRKFLLRQGSQQMDTEKLMQISQSAAQMLAELGQIDDAIDLYLSAGAWQPAIDLLLKNIVEIVLKGRYKIVSHWLDRLPGKLFDQIPVLLYYQATCRQMFDDPINSMPIYKRALVQFKKRKDEEGVAMAHEGIAHSLAGSFEYKRLYKWLPIFDSLYRRFRFRKNTAIKAYLLSALLHALVLQQPSRPDLPSLETEALALIDDEIPIRPKFTLLALLISHKIITGLLNEAQHFLNFFHDQFSNEDLPSGAIHVMHHLEAFYLWCCADFDQCCQVVSDAMAHAEANRQFAYQTLLACHGCAAALGLGDLKGAVQWLEAIKTRLPHLSFLEKASYHILAVHLALVQEKSDKMESHSKLACQYAHDTGFASIPPTAHLGRAVVLHTLSQPDQAVVHLDKALSVSCQHCIRRIEFGCYMLQAEIALDTADEDKSVAVLKKALAFGKRYNYLHTHFWRPKVMTRLCIKALEKDIETDYVRRLIRERSLIPDRPIYEINAWPWPLKVFTMGQQKLEINDQLVTHTRKTPKRPLTLLNLLIARGGRDVPIDQLCDILWPDADGDKAFDSYKITLRRLRSLIGIPKLFVQCDNALTIDRCYTWIDAWAFEYWVDCATDRWDNRHKHDMNSTIGLVRKAMNLYQGPFLEDDSTFAPYITYRRKLQKKFTQIVYRLGRWYQKNDQCEAALACYQGCMDAEPSNENWYHCIMVCYHRLGQMQAALETYHQCIAELDEYMGLQPSAKIRILYEKIKKEHYA